MNPDAQSAAKPKRRWYQFSLRTLLVGMSVIAVGFGLLVNRVIIPAQRQRAAVKMVERLGGRVFYADTAVHDSWFIQRLHDWLPRDYFDELAIVSLDNIQVTDADLAHLKDLTALLELSLYNTQATDAGLIHLKGLTALSVLYLGETQVTDAGLVHLKEFTALKRLSLHTTQVTDAGLAHLKGLPVLSVLYLGQTQVTDAGLTHLKGLSSLSELYLHNTQVRDAGVAELQEALPNCKIFH